MTDLGYTQKQFHFVTSNTNTARDLPLVQNSCRLKSPPQLIDWLQCVESRYDHGTIYFDKLRGWYFKFFASMARSVVHRHSRKAKCGRIEGPDPVRSKKQTCKVWPKLVASGKAAKCFPHSRNAIS